MPKILDPGGVYTVTTTTICALPPVVVRVQSSAACEVSLDQTNWSILANSTTGAETGAMFVRCTTGQMVIAVKRLD